jgi:16S rRNA (guanine966-N2)-methyltransferase
VRVIAGRYGGRRLKAPRGRGTRPTSDRVREALFSLLGPIDGAEVLDLFAGTGALGIEALSRGAVRAVFVERNHAALSALEANLTALDLHEPEAETRRADALGALRTARERDETYDLVFVDPPYGDAQAWGRKLSAASWRAIGGSRWGSRESTEPLRSSWSDAMATRPSPSIASAKHPPDEHSMNTPSPFPSPLRPHRHR